MNDSLSREFLLQEAEHTEMFDKRDKETMLEMIRSCPAVTLEAERHGEWLTEEPLSRTFGLRLCCVKNLRMPNEEKKRALFHRWVDNAYIQDAILVGSVSGQVWEVGGLVEYENGEVDIVPCKSIEFLSEKEAK